MKYYGNVAKKWQGPIMEIASPIADIPQTGDSDKTICINKQLFCSNFADPLLPKLPFGQSFYVQVCFTKLFKSIPSHGNELS